MTSRTRHRIARAATWLAICGVLALVFALYTRPGFMVTLIDQLWACF
ncbi:hypothetical protein WKW79_13080 [Variovorax robiniae]|uniref:Uncharacterized protein n=1 Tax=Variovorax robiniae TaxID=1836199 RepID=A0ABU8X703_9BURK